MLPSVGSERIGHDLATEQQSSLVASEASDGNIIVMNNLLYLFCTLQKAYSHPSLYMTFRASPKGGQGGITISILQMRL